MTARKGWVFDDPPPPSEWRDSHYSRTADRIAEQEREAIRAAAVKYVEGES